MFGICLVLCVIVIICDQVFKYLAAALLTPGQPVSLISGIAELSYVENTGAAMGIFSNSRVLLIIVTIVVIAALIIYLRVDKNLNRLSYVSSALIIGGGIGNLIDRFLWGYVIDYFNVTFMKFYVFNFADACICVGAALFVISILLPDKNKKESKK